MPGVVYTAIFGPHGDQLRQPPKTNDQYVAFVDEHDPLLRAGVYRGWELRPAAWRHPVPRRQARGHKCLPHRLFPEAAWSLWLDGSMQLKTPPAKLLPLLVSDVCVFKHRYRDCLYDEAKECKRLGLDYKETINQQMHGYSVAGYPAARGLSETTAVLRRHTEDAAKFNEQWHGEISAGSLRDQLSFDYVCWRHGITPSRFPGTIDRSGHFRYWRHKRSRPRNHQ